MVPRTLPAATLAALIAACAAPPAAPPPAPPQREIVTVAPPPAPPEPTAEERARLAAVRVAADDAVRELRVALEDVDEACGATLAPSEGACEALPLGDLAARYQAHYADADDPRREEGRIDALPRLGGRDVAVDILAVRLRAACVARCDLARRTAAVDARADAVAACLAGRGKAACASLAKRFPRGDASVVAAQVGACDDECRARREDAARVRAREAARPRTEAAARACFSACVKRCTGGRVVPGPDGVYVRDPDDWCGTCEVSCRADCAVRP